MNTEKKEPGLIVVKFELPFNEVEKVLDSLKSSEVTVLDHSINRYSFTVAIIPSDKDKAKEALLKIGLNPGRYEII